MRVLNREPGGPFPAISRANCVRFIAGSILAQALPCAPLARSWAHFEALAFWQSTNYPMQTARPIAHSSGPPLVTHPCATERAFSLAQHGFSIGPRAALHLPHLAYQAGQKRAPIQRIAPRRVWQGASGNKRNAHHGLALDGCSAYLELHVHKAARARFRLGQTQRRELVMFALVSFGGRRLV